MLLPSPRIKAVVILTTTTAKILQSSAISGSRLVISMPFVIHCRLPAVCFLVPMQPSLGDWVYFIWKCDFVETSKCHNEINGFLEPKFAKPGVGSSGTRFQQLCGGE